MRNIIISDIALQDGVLFGKEGISFRKKMEYIKLMDRISVPYIELGILKDTMADHLYLKSAAGTVSDSKIAVSVGLNPELAEKFATALEDVSRTRLQVTTPVSTSQMEYICHAKPESILASVKASVEACKKVTEDVEFVAEDATRAKDSFLFEVVKAAIASGAKTVTFCDDAGSFLPDEFAAFIRAQYEAVPELSGISVGVRCANTLCTADASAVAAVMQGVSEIKTTSVSDKYASMNGIVQILKTKADYLNATTSIGTTELKRVISNANQMLILAPESRTPFDSGVRETNGNVFFSSHDKLEDLIKVISQLGYDLNEEDKLRVWNAFQRIAKKKEKVGIPELEAILASEAMQVPSVYSLESYAVNTGNNTDILAHIKLRKGSEILDGLSLGDGPIDAAFLAIEKITGHHYELDDFQIQAITEGREAMGQTIVKLRSDGKVYSGKGISTDIIGSGIEAYIHALNKILHEGGVV